MKKIIYILLFCVFPFLIYAQVEDATEHNSRFTAPKFYQDFLNFYSGKDSTTRLDVFVQVPYNSLQFVKTGSEFTSNFSITVSVFDEDKEHLVVEKTWSDKLEAADFNQTVSKESFNLSMKSFYLKPGKYSIRTALNDKESRNEYPIERKVNVKDFSSQPAVSDIMLISKRSVVDGKNNIVPNIMRNVATQKDGLPVFFEIYSDSSIPVSVEYQISSKKGEYIFDSTESRNIDSGRTQVFHTIRDSSFSLGYYNLKILLKDKNDEVIATTDKGFFSRWAGVPITITDLDKAIDQLIYIGTSSDIDYIEEAKTKEEKMKRYMAFWKKKDPTPTTEENEIFDEYYRRIAYANEHFSHYIDGWRTDRGMVFILLGPPNNVDRHPFDLDSKPYEVWEYYNLNRRLIFVDETGFGDFRLVTPLTGDLYRFRR